MKAPLRQRPSREWTSTSQIILGLSPQDCGCPAPSGTAFQERSCAPISEIRSSRRLPVASSKTCRSATSNPSDRVSPGAIRLSPESRTWNGAVPSRQSASVVGAEILHRLDLCPDRAGLIDPHRFRTDTELQCFRSREPVEGGCRQKVHRRRADKARGKRCCRFRVEFRGAAACSRCP